MATLRAIAAMSLNRVIGLNNTIPWRIPEELKWFKEVTYGQKILMGRKTFESIKKKLEGRTHFVLTNNSAQIDGVTVVNNLRQLDDIDGDLWVCGGANVYKQLLPKCKDLYLTIVKIETAGDAYFPELPMSYKLDKIVRSNDKFYIEHWINE